MLFIILNFLMINFYCTQTIDDSFFKSMGDQTDYNLIAGKLNYDEYSISGCKQIGFWHLIRHAASYPNYEDIQEIGKFLPNLKKLILSTNRSSLSDADLDQLKNWNWNVLDKEDCLITPHGNVTIKMLGLRTWIRLKQLIYETRLMDQVKIKSTDDEWTKQSAEKYIQGVFRFWPFNVDIQTNPIDQDFLIKYTDICDKYLVDINSNKNMCPELSSFNFFSTENRNLKQIFQKRLGVSFFLTNIDKAFDLALKACQYQFLINQKVSVWCKFFDLETIKLIEYKNDIESNCKFGYKYDISRMMACDLIKDLIKSLKEYRKSYETFDNKLSKFAAYFTNGDIMHSFLTSLGVGKSQDNFDTENITVENPNRKFRTSWLNPTNSNIGFLLFKCEKKFKQSKYLLRVYLNENLIKVDGCQSSDCDLTEFLNYFTFFSSICQSTEHSCKL